MINRLINVKRLYRILCVLLVSGVLCTCMQLDVSAQPASSTPLEVAVKVDAANIRFEPSASSRIVGRVHRGEILDVYLNEPRGGWYLIQKGTLRGWIRSSLVVPALRVDQERPGDNDRGDLLKAGWKFYAAAQEIEYFYHGSSVEREWPFVRLWSRDRRPVGTWTSMRLTLDCERKEYMLTESIGYKSDGSVSAMNDFRTIARPKEIAPDSVMFTLAKELCKRPVEFN